MAIQNDYQKFVSFSQNSIPENITAFWSFVKSKKNNVSLPSAVSYNGAKSTNLQEMCNLFANYFESVYKSQNSSTQNFSDTSAFANDININSLAITSDMVFQKLLHLKGRLSPGPDGLSEHFIKMCSPTLSLPLSILYQLSINNGHFPSQWKLAHVFPIFKSGDRCLVTNYRPISMLSCVSKVFEHIVSEHIFNTFRSTIDMNQHGFYSGRSTQTNLLQYVDFINRTLESRGEVDAVYVDFSKAFDQVDHNLLCHKLSLYGINGNLLKWINSYLQDRTQVIKLSSAVSRDIKVTSGVPQGSHLAPILFSLFINDLYGSLTNSNYLAYADDLKLYISVSSTDDRVLLQNDLDALGDWCRRNYMSLNSSKCNVITFSRKTHPTAFNYYIGDASIQRTNQVKDLGVLFDVRLTFNPHIDIIVSRSLQLCGFIKRTCQDFTDPFVQITLFNTLVRSILEYCSIIWSPYHAVHIKRLENIQKKLVNSILFKLGINKNDYSYKERLNILGMDSLENRRRTLSLKFGFRLLHNHIDCPTLVSNMSFKVPSFNARGHNTFNTPYHRTNYGKHNPFDRLFAELNNIQADIFNMDYREFVRHLRSTFN